MSRRARFVAGAVAVLLLAGGAVATARLGGGGSEHEEGEPKQARAQPHTERPRTGPPDGGQRAGGEAALRRLVAASSKRPPHDIVMLVFDELPLTSLLGPGELIDRARYPAFARLADRALWFRGATAIHDSTALAVPAILEGRYPRRGLGSDYASHPRNLFTLLASRYSLHVSEEATGLCPPRLCEPTPGTTISHVGHGKVRRFQRWFAQLHRGPGRALWFKHLLFPHVPWQYLPSGLSYRRVPNEPIPGLNGMRGFGNPWLVELSYQRHLLQLGFADRLLAQVVGRLKRERMWGRALFVVVADHGIGFHVGAQRRTVTPRNVQDLAPVPLFLKLPGQPHGLTIDRHVETIDVLPTILAAAHVALPQPLDGRTLLRPSATRRDQVTVYHRIGNRLNTIGGRYTFDPGEVAARRRAAVRRKLTLFGAGGGREPRRIFEIGPYPALVGKPVDDLTVQQARPTTRVDQARELRAVDPRSGFVPAELTGTLPHGRPGGGRAVAVAVNGRIAAVGRTFSLAGSRAESFAVIVPDWALRPGANDVRVYAIVDDGAGLRPL